MGRGGVVDVVIEVITAAACTDVVDRILVVTSISEVVSCVVVEIVTTRTCGTGYMNFI